MPSRNSPTSGSKALLSTEYAVSPHRVSYNLALIGDWIADDPVTIETKAILPEWTRWLGERAGLAATAVDIAVGVAAGAPRPPSDCAGLDLR